MEFLSQEPLALLVNVLIVLVTLVAGVLPAAEGLLVRTGRLFVAGLRRGERLHSAQPDDALHRGGSDGVSRRDWTRCPTTSPPGTSSCWSRRWRLVAVGLALLFWKGPRSSQPARTRLLTGAAALAVSGLLLGGAAPLAFATGDLSNQFANLAFAYEDYGFSYCFLQTWLNRGIRRPSGYSRPRWRRSARRWRRRRRT